jgi:hypothetical protein
MGVINSHDRGKRCLSKIGRHCSELILLIQEGRTKEALETAGDLAADLRGLQEWQRSVLRRKANGR